MFFSFSECPLWQIQMLMRILSCKAIKGAITFHRSPWNFVVHYCTWKCFIISNFFWTSQGKWIQLWQNLFLCQSINPMKPAVWSSQSIPRLLGETLKASPVFLSRSSKMFLVASSNKKTWIKSTSLCSWQ